MYPLRTLTRLVAIALCLAVIPACDALPGQKTLTDAQVTSYIQAYKNLRKVAPNLAAKMRQTEGLPEVGQSGFLEVEKAVQAAGFKDYPEFVRVNAAVAWAFSQGQGKAFMTEMSAAHKQAYAQIDAQLENPALPAATRAELEQARARIEAEYTKNKGWADLTMNLTSNLTNKESVEVVMRRRKELEAAFTGR